jgi:hypothetical protein
MPRKRPRQQQVPLKRLRKKNLNHQAMQSAAGLRRLQVAISRSACKAAFDAKTFETQASPDTQHYLLIIAKHTCN